MLKGPHLDVLGRGKKVMLPPLCCIAVSQLNNERGLTQTCAPKGIAVVENGASANWCFFGLFSATGKLTMIGDREKPEKERIVKMEKINET